MRMMEATRQTVATRNFAQFTRLADGIHSNCTAPRAATPPDTMAARHEARKPPMLPRSLIALNGVAAILKSVAFNPSSMSRFLVRATSWLGAGVLSLPAIPAIRHVFPHAHIAI